MSKNVSHLFSDTENTVLQTVAHNIDQTLQWSQSVEQKISSVKKLIYNLLTKRPGFQKVMWENPHFLMDNYANLRPYREYYQKHTEELEKRLPTSDNLSWLQINCTNFPRNAEQMNLKIYKTLHPFQLDFLKKLPQLYEKLKVFWEQNEIEISFKIPSTYALLYAWSDNLVMHFSAPNRKIAVEDVENIQNILENWLQENSIETISRNFGRTELATDMQDTSFSGYIASYYAQQALTGKYSSNAVLRGAIEASQKPNFSFSS